MPFTDSITSGGVAGLIGLLFIKGARGQGREVHPLLDGPAAACALYFRLVLLH